MAFMDKFLNAFGMADDDDDDEDYNDVYDEKPAKKEPRTQKREVVENEAPKIREEKKAVQPISRPQVVKSQAPSKRMVTAGMEVCVIKPTSFDDSKEITDTLLMGKPVILNVEGLNLEIAQRIIDVCSGACYAIEGSLRKVSNYIFILTPHNVEISGDLQNMLDSFGVSGI